MKNLVLKCMFCNHIARTTTGEDLICVYCNDLESNQEILNYKFKVYNIDEELTNSYVLSNVHK